MRGWTVVALFAVAGQAAQAEKCVDPEVWTVPNGVRSTAEHTAAPDLATNGELKIVGVRGGQALVRGLAMRSIVLEGGGERVPVDVAELPRDDSRYTIAVIAPRRTLRPGTLYRLRFEPRPGGAMLTWLEGRSYKTGPATEPRPEWRGEPTVRQASCPTCSIFVALPSTSRAAHGRFTLICPDGDMQVTREAMTDGAEVQITEPRCQAPGTKALSPAAFAIVEIVDAGARVSLPRRVAVAPPVIHAHGPGLALRVLLFILLPFAGGYATVALVMRSRARRFPSL